MDPDQEHGCQINKIKREENKCPCSFNGCLSNISKIDSLGRKRRHTEGVCPESKDQISNNFAMNEIMDNKEDDPAILTKRKKQLENMKGGAQKEQKCPRYEWTQSLEDVTMSLRFDGVKGDQMRNIDVQFSDTDVTLKLQDGKSWTWTFWEEIFREASRVKVKKQKVTLHMKKKKPIHWESLELIKESLSPVHVAESTSQVQLTADSEESLEPAGAQASVSDDSGAHLLLASEAITDLQDDGDENVEEKLIKEEEPVYQLMHVKHNFFEYEESFHVHIYVKDVDKDNIKVHFEKKSLSVKFQTGNPAFLKLHPETNEETVFCWTILLRGEIVPENSKYKLSNSCIELKLIKAEKKKWGDLEAVKGKEMTIGSKSDSWVPINNVAPASEAGLNHSMSDSAIPVQKQALEKETQEEKREQAPATASPQKDLTAQQKPTCKVQPLNKNSLTSEMVVTPGFTGLDNLGNTCFMNGVLQCLANTREFRDYFIDHKFQDDLNIDNVLGYGGKLAVSFAVLMRFLWSGKYYSYAPAKLKALVAQKASQFTGFAQHDAQEFLAFLLDGLHEDLNRIKKKPYTETVEDAGRPDEVVAAEAWEVYKKRNDSFVVDLFQGQYKSKLVCPVCGKVSITFDPFLYLSLPLPKRQRLLPITFMWKDPYRKPVRYMLRLAKEASVEALKDSLEKKTGVNPKHMRVFEAYKGRIHKIFSKEANLSTVQANDVIICCEVLSEEVAGETVYEIAVVQRTLMPNQFPLRCCSCRKPCPEGSKLKRCTKCFKVGYCDQACQKNHWQYHRMNCKMTPEPVGTPFILSIPESRATFAQLCKLMEAYARYSVDVFQPPVKTDLPSKLTSHPSSSNLSSSSQSESSGSLNSLDSQSSFSSSCTITAEQEQNLDEHDDHVDSPQSDTSLTVQPGNDVGLSNLAGVSSCLGSTNSGHTSPVLGASVSSSTCTVFDDVYNQEIKLENQEMKSDSGIASLSDVKLNLDSKKHSIDDLKISSASCLDKFSEKGDKVSEKEFAPFVNPVLGVQTGDTERSTPLFYIKPVNQEGIGLTGEGSERLEDKGDVTLDLTEKFFLSVDWKNNDKIAGYVLVQSKEMEFENDRSMMTASLEENNSATLEQCLELFTEPETLSPEEAWYCPSCKEHREATKQLSTWKLPHTLIIQLKRFSFRNFIWRDKIDKMVEFPTRGLDLSAYYIGTRPSNEPPPIYDLYGVVNHHGGILGGHYTSFVRCPERYDSKKSEVGWRLCDDSRVSTVSHEKNVVTRAAYLLCYRRREVFVPCPLTGTPTLETEIQQDVDAESRLSSDSGDLEEELTGELTIDESQQDEDELPDLEDCEPSKGTQEDSDKAGVMGNIPVPVIELGMDGELGYTDMDSVD